MLRAALAIAVWQVSITKATSSTTCATFIFDHLSQMQAQHSVKLFNTCWNPSRETMLQPLSGLAGLHSKCSGPAPDRQVSCCLTPELKSLLNVAFTSAQSCAVVCLNRSDTISSWVLLWSGWLHGNDNASRAVLEHFSCNGKCMQFARIAGVSCGAEWSPSTCYLLDRAMSFVKKIMRLASSCALWSQNAAHCSHTHVLGSLFVVECQAWAIKMLLMMCARQYMYMMHNLSRRRHFRYSIRRHFRYSIRGLDVA